MYVNRSIKEKIMDKAIKSYVNDFLDYCEIEKGLAPTTSRNYARFLRPFFSWLSSQRLADLKPHELRDAHITKYRMWLSRLQNAVRRNQTGLSMATQTRYLIALRAMLAFFHEKNIASLPTEKIKLPKESRERKVKFLDLDMVDKLLQSPTIKTQSGLRDRAILETLFSTGARVAELAGLDRKHLAGAQNKKDFEMSIIGKGRHPRTIYFSERALEWLKRYLVSREDGEDALFIRRGGPSKAPARLSVRGIELIV
ncbi:MAG: integrase/recombinase XerC, partial [Parcubacteria group bacterium Gr01-1014_66]